MQEVAIVRIAVVLIGPDRSVDDRDAACPVLRPCRRSHEREVAVGQLDDLGRQAKPTLSRWANRG